MSIGSTLLNIGKSVAPFIPGVGPALSLGLNAGDALMNGRGGGGKAGGGDVNPIVSSASNLTDAGSKLLDSGTSTIDHSNSLLTPVTQRNQRLLSGDQQAIRSELAPETDAIGQQFQNVRNMISGQPRGGGKTSTMAQLPIEEIKVLANLMSQERSKAAGEQSDISGRLLSAGENERGLGMQGLSAGGNLLLGKGNQDVARRGQNIDLGSKIAETIAELGFLLKGNGGAKAPGGGASPSRTINPGSFPISRFPNPMDSGIPDAGGYGH